MRWLVGLLLAACAFAQDSFAPLPAKITSAKSVYISNLTDNPQVADAAYSELKKWGRFEVVDSPEKADLIFKFQVLLGEASVNTGIIPMGTSTVSISRPVRPAAIRFSIVSAADGELWTVTKPADTNPKKFGSRACLEELRKRIEISIQTEKK